MTHPLQALEGESVGPCTIRLGLLTQLASSGWRRFSLYLEDKDKRRCTEPVIDGVYSVGGKGIAPWMDISYLSRLAFKGEAENTLDLTNSGLDRPLFTRLSNLIPANGHIMVEYESLCHKMTHDLLRMRVPPAATPLGALLFDAGFQGGFKDWYIAEGGFEGPQKLQANKPLNEEHARRKAEELANELKSFLELQINAPEIEQAKIQAKKILQLLPH